MTLQAAGVDALVSSLTRVKRAGKPRRSGLTMVLDKSFGTSGARDLVETAGDFVDIVKLTSTTSVFTHRRALEQKVGLYRGAGIAVGPGGTLTESALWRGVFKQFLEFARQLGCSMVEISDGTIDLSREKRNAAIAQARAAGFDVVTEVGRKEWSPIATTAVLASDIASDIASGAKYVVIEAMESGAGVGVFDVDGNPRLDEIDRLQGAAEGGALMWEAPLRRQQEFFVNRFGSDVNLGNIPPAEVLVLEATRHALTGIPFRTAYLAEPLQ